MSGNVRPEIARRAARFQELHKGPEILVLPNPWDIGSARLLAHLGFSALATTSAGLAFSIGRSDGDGAVSVDETFQNVKEIVDATALPVTADLENGFGASPETVAATIRRAGEVGLAGASIEDATYRKDAPIFDRVLAVERIQAAVEAARDLPTPFVLTARAENFIRGNPNLDDTLWRLKAYEDAGADVLYSPGLPNKEALREVCTTLNKPVNHLAGGGGTRFNLEELADIGVRRVSVGSSFARAAYTAFLNAGREVLHQGTFTYLEGLPSVVDFNGLIVGEE